MLLSELIKNTEYTLINGDADISRIEYDSRRVKPGEIFACVVGTFQDGHNYAASAVEAGASALIAEHELPLDVPQVIVPNTRRAMAELAIKLYDYPAKQLRIIGVTGTNGKTTTTYMIKAIAEKCGLKVGLIGTIRNIIGNRVISTQRTTPESTELQEILRDMVNEGVDLVVMEVSSHSLDQERVYGLEFEIGGFTNLTQDHLDYHKTFENYLAAKKKLFERSGFAVVNADDVHSAMLLEGLSIPRMSYGVREKADISATNIEINVRDVEFDMSTPIGQAHVSVPIPGLFNVFNAMLAAGICIKLGFPLSAIVDGLAAVAGVTGRMEALDTTGFPFTVILDFAHTPDGIINLLTSVREFAKKRIIISVSSRLGSVPYLANPLQKNQFILDKDSQDPWVQWCLSSKEQMIEGFRFQKENLDKAMATGLLGDVEETKKAYEQGEAPWCITYHFMPQELEEILRKNGVKNISLSGPGAYGRTIPREILVKIMNDPEQKADFLDFCYQYDSNPYVCGMGKDNLFAMGEVGDG